MKLNEYCSYASNWQITSSFLASSFLFHDLQHVPFKCNVILRSLVLATTHTMMASQAFAILRTSQPQSYATGHALHKSRHNHSYFIVFFDVRTTKFIHCHTWLGKNCQHHQQKYRMDSLVQGEKKQERFCTLMHPWSKTERESSIGLFELSSHYSLHALGDHENSEFISSVRNIWIIEFRNINFAIHLAEEILSCFNHHLQSIRGRNKL